MKTIFKYELSDQSIAIPIGAGILTAQHQGGSLFVWAMVESENALEDRFILIRLTGQPLGDVGSYIGMFQSPSGSLVFHLFNEVGY
jgi:hypothetical protein